MRGRGAHVFQALSTWALRRCDVLHNESTSYFLKPIRARSLWNILCTASLWHLQDQPDLGISEVQRDPSFSFRASFSTELFRSLQNSEMASHLKLLSVEGRGLLLSALLSNVRKLLAHHLTLCTAGRVTSVTGNEAASWLAVELVALQQSGPCEPL